MAEPRLAMTRPYGIHDAETAILQWLHAVTQNMIGGMLAYLLWISNRGQTYAWMSLS